MQIELAYINTKHPDFTEAGLVHRSISESIERDMKKFNLQERPTSADADRVRRSEGVTQVRYATLGMHPAAVATAAVPSL